MRSVSEGLTETIVEEMLRPKHTKCSFRQQASKVGPPPALGPRTNHHTALENPKSGPKSRYRGNEAASHFSGVRREFLEIAAVQDETLVKNFTPRGYQAF
jgi:hypothetical protein